MVTDPGGLLLAIDTSNERCSAAVLDMATGALLAKADPLIGKGHVELLMDVIATVLRSAEATWSDLTKLAIGIGPGSFTGIRVAVATARGLEISLGIPSVGVTTLEAQAEPHRGDGRPVLAVHDARRGEVYAALFASDGRELAPPEAMKPDRLPEFCAAFGIDPAGLGVVGTGAVIAANVLPGSLIMADDGETSAPIEAIARIGRLREPGALPLPLYLRGADAKHQVPAGLRAVVASAGPV